MKLILALVALATLLSAETIKLPKPDISGGKTLYTTLTLRSSSRSFDKNRPVSRQKLSQILWSAGGVNRPELGKRTSPSAWGNNEVEIYVLLKEGTYKYEPLTHSLLEISKKDSRIYGGEQKFVADAPATLVMISDLRKITQTSDERSKVNTSYIDAGYMSQNIYLASASEGLVTGARAYINHEKIKKALKLKRYHRVIIANSIGYEKK